MYTHSVSRLLGLAILTAATTVLSPLAIGQPVLPSPNTESLSGTDRGSIEGYIAFYISQLREGDVDAVEGARAALLVPLNDPDLTVPFRLAYTEALGQPLASMISAESDTHRIANALQVSGRLADRTSVRPIIAALESGDQAVQLAAASAIRNMLVELSLEGVTPVQRRPADDLFSAARAAIRDSEDSIIAEALTSAVLGGSANTRMRDRGLAIVLSVARERAYTALTEDELQDQAWPEAVRVALGEVRTRLVSAPADEQFPREFLRDAADLAGIAFGMVRVELEVASDESLALVQHRPLAVLAENVKNLAVSRATGQPVQAAVVRAAFLDALERDEPMIAQAAVDECIDSIGDAPFGLDPARYTQ